MGLIYAMKILKLSFERVRVRNKVKVGGKKQKK